MRILNKKLLSFVVAILLIVSAVPLSAFATPASDIPKEMLENVFLDALAYTGYNVNAQKNDGTIFKTTGNSVSSSIRSNITYGTALNGTETVSNSGTVSGLAPNIAKFEQSGLCCASYVSYVYFNYLPNISGIDTSNIQKPTNYRSATAYNTLANSWVSSGTARRISFTQSGSTFTPAETIPIGALISFKDSAGSIRHVAIYAGAYNGKHYITHVGNENGPEFCTVEGMTKGGLPQTVNQIVVPNFVNPTGRIQVKKTDTNGNALAGAYFSATLSTDSSKQYLIGPTDSNGHAKTDGNIPYGTYKIKETVFPTNYRSYGVTEWTVTVGASNNGVAEFSAVNELIPGNIKIVKTSENGKISGIRFTVSGNGVEKAVATDKNGEVSVTDLKPGLYSVTENSYEAYVPQSKQNVTVASGQTSTVYFNNKLKRGNLEVIKTAEDGFAEGLNFGLKGNSVSGESVEIYATSDKDGKVYFENVPIGTYKLFEKDTPSKYVAPAELSVTVKWNETVQVGMYNALKKWQAEIYKVDSEISSLDTGAAYGKVQGGSTLGGAIYGLYKDGILLKEYTTDKNGYILTDYYPCGDNYYLKEIKPSLGYLLDNTVYYIDSASSLYSAEYNTTYLNCYESVIKSNIMLIKHRDNGATQIETPEIGAQFEIYLKASGNYNSAKESERDILIINKHGIAESKELPYGVYTVKQTKGKEGYELIEAFDVTIEKHSEIYSYIINNAPFTAYIDIVKKDATTGKVIPAAGIGFKVKNSDTGNFIVQSINYPTPMDIEIFYTDGNGQLRLPEKLEYGKYELIEQCTANGYVLNSEPIEFFVDGSCKTVMLEKFNFPQMGVITIDKQGEIFASVDEKDGLYKPVYALSELEGAEFSIYAAEDIYTPDGTLRNRKGEKVDTVITGKNGKAVTKQLFLGKYEIKEEKAPDGMVISDDLISVELIYAGQEIKITSAAVAVKNARQKAFITLKKQLETDEEFYIGFDNEYENIKFGLFAAEVLIAEDGSYIPKDALLEIITVDSEGNACFLTDVPMGSKLYIKEIETDNHYIISEKEYPIEFIYQGQSISTVNITANGGKAIENKLIRGKIEGIKTDEENLPIAKALFGLFKCGTEKYTKENAILTAESDETGAFVFENIPYGKWVIKELSCPKEYVISDKLYEVDITADGEELSLNAVNRKVKGSVRVVKVSGKDRNQKLSGAEFELYADIDQDGTFNPYIDTFVGKLTETEEGTYELDSLAYGGYFLYESKAPKNFLRDERYFYFQIKQDGEMVNVENIKGVGFVNEYIEVSESPKTGDASKPMVFISVAFASILAMAFSIFKLKKKL